MSILGPISGGGNFWCSSIVVNTGQFFTKLCTKMSMFGRNLVWRQFLVFINCGEHTAKVKTTYLLTKHTTRWISLSCPSPKHTPGNSLGHATIQSIAPGIARSFPRSTARPWEFLEAFHDSAHPHGVYHVARRRHRSPGSDVDCKNMSERNANAIKHNGNAINFAQSNLNPTVNDE